MTPSQAQIDDAREWAKAQRTFDHGGLAKELEENGVEDAGHWACRLIAKWCALSYVKTAGGSPASRRYHWLHAE
jgi:hypothetical protein